MNDRMFRQLLSVPATFRYFEEVARTGSFRKASEVLRIAPSAVHRQITMLEECIGTRLFHRNRGQRGVKLTAAGEVLKLRTGQAIEMLSRAADEIKALSDGHRGQVSLGVNDTLATDVVSNFLAIHGEVAPRIDYDIRIDDSQKLTESVLNGSLDVMLCFGAPSRAGLRTLWKRNLRTVVVVNADHPLASRTSVTLGECAQFPLAMEKDTDWTRGFAERAFREGGFHPRVVLRTNSYGLMRSYVASGRALSIQTALPGIHAEGDGELRRVPIVSGIEGYSVLTCCTASGSHLPPASQVFVEELLQYLNQALPEQEEEAA